MRVCQLFNRTSVSGRGSYVGHIDKNDLFAVIGRLETAHCCRGPGRARQYIGGPGHALTAETKDDACYVTSVARQVERIPSTILLLFFVFKKLREFVVYRFQTEKIERNGKVPTVVINIYYIYVV